MARSSVLGASVSDPIDQAKSNFTLLIFVDASQALPLLAVLASSWLGTRTGSLAASAGEPA